MNTYFVPVVLFIPGAQFLRATYAPGSGPIFLDQLECDGTENDLLQCSARHPLGLQVMCDHSEDAGIRCQGNLYVCILRIMGLHATYLR